MDNMIEKKRFNIGRLIRNKAVQAFLIAVILFGVGEMTVKGFSEFEHIMTILSLSSFLGIIALGQTIVIIGGGEGIDLSVGAMVSISTVIGAQLMNGENKNLLFAIVVVLLVGFLIGSVTGIGIA